MKKFGIFLCASVLALSAYVSPDKVNSGITGMVAPPDAVQKVWAFNGADSVAAIPESGKFMLEVKPGNWKLVVVAIAPYKNALQDVTVKEGQSTDVGVINLTKE